MRFISFPRLLFLLVIIYLINLLIFQFASAQLYRFQESNWLEFQKKQLLLVRDHYQALLDTDKGVSWRLLDESIQKKDSIMMIDAVGRILFLLGDLDSEKLTYRNDSNLMKAVQAFKKRNALKWQGGMDKAFMKCIRKPVAGIIRSIDNNLFRLNKIVPFNDICLLVNIPDFQMYVFKKNAVLYKCDVIVGRKKNPTVTFHAQLNSIIFHPYWYVPPQILRKEILPLVKRNPGYLKSHHMEWYGNGVRQLPGADNALGKLKFLFPNRYNIYMHDTPNKHLFNQTVRAFSHGCIRLKQANELASLILVDMEGWSRERFEAAWGSGKQETIFLKNLIDVRIVYLNAFVDDARQLQLRDDLYGLD